MSYPIFEDVSSKFEYVMIGVSADLPKQGECHQPRVNGVLLQKLHGSTVLLGLPFYVPISKFLTGTGEAVQFRYTGQLPSSDMLETTIKGDLAYAYRSVRDDVLRAKIQEAELHVAEPSPCVVGGCYRHYNNGKMYQILCIAKDHTNDCDVDVVVYSSVDDPTMIWTRRYDEFFEIVEQNHVKVPRFTFCYMV